MVGGILNINKPRGIASFTVVKTVKRLTGIKRVGHAGTLDPIADGVLPICIGWATRVVEYLVAAPKAYRTVVRLGVVTNTFDSEGTVVSTTDPSGITREAVEELLPQFVGEIDQLPPMYSALKHEGQPLYRYARAGKVAPRDVRKVSVYGLRLLRFAPSELEIEIECGRGAYVRTLVHDLGARLGCGAHVSGLTRLRSGPFRLEEAVDLEHFQEAAEHSDWKEFLYAADRVLESWPAAILDSQHTGDVRRGRLLILPPGRDEYETPDADWQCRAYSDEGELVAILRHRGAGGWHPERVFAPL